MGNGEYTEADLAMSGADWVDPISVTAFGHRLWTMPPNSQGYVLAASAWVADGLALPADPDIGPILYEVIATRYEKRLFRILCG